MAVRVAMRSSSQGVGGGRATTSLIAAAERPISAVLTMLELVSRGIAVGEIPDETFFGHHLFCIKDPDGNGITIYTSHALH
jgi:hypothetical protein